MFAARWVRDYPTAIAVAVAYALQCKNESKSPIQQSGAKAVAKYTRTPQSEEKGMSNRKPFEDHQGEYKPKRRVVLHRKSLTMTTE